MPRAAPSRFPRRAPSGYRRRVDVARPSRRARASAVAAGAGIAACVSGCLPGAFPRTAEVAKPGEFALTISASAGTLEQEEATVRATPSAAPGKQRSVLALPYGFDPNMLFGGWVGMIEVSARMGLFAPCEGALDASLLRPGLEMRCMLVRESRVTPVSIAMSTGVFYSTFGGGPWGRAGVDVSRWLGDVAPLFGVYMSAGPERHGFKIDVPPVDTTNVYDEFGGGPYVYAVRNELRLSVPLGVAIAADSARRGRFVVGVVPYVIPWASSFPRERCIECGDATAGGVVASYGASLALGYEAFR
jgi:hypothetical protein